MKFTFALVALLAATNAIYLRGDDEKKKDKKDDKMSSVNRADFTY